MEKYIKINDNDDVVVALEAISMGEEIIINGKSIKQ